MEEWHLHVKKKIFLRFTANAIAIFVQLGVQGQVEGVRIWNDYSK